jgi:hypothetical protein
MKKHYQGILATALLFIASLGTAQATLVALGDYTTDTDTGMDWLDLDLTLGMSFNQVNAELGAGGLFEGWQVATLDQAHTFLTNAGWIGPFDSSNVSNVGFVANFKALTTSLTDDPAGDLGALSFTNDFADTLGSNRFVDDQGTGITSYSFTSPIDPSVANQNTSTFLVRTSAVPLPAAFWLFGTGLVFLIRCTKSIN